MDIIKTLIGVDFTNEGRTVTIIPSTGGWDVCTPEGRGAFREHENAVSWAMAMIGGRLLSCHHNDKGQVALCLVEVETKDEIFGSYVAKFSDGNYVSFHCKYARSVLSVGVAIGQVLVGCSLQRDESELFRDGFAYVHDYDIQGTAILAMEWWDEQDARAVSNCE